MTEDISISIQGYGTVDNDPFDVINRLVSRRFAEASAGAPLFTSDAQDLYQIYLDGFETPEQRQHHTCHACRRFIETFGSLAVIDPETGALESALWPDTATAPEIYWAPIEALRYAVGRARVTGVFAWEGDVWGQPVTGTWTHFAVVPGPEHRHRNRLHSAGQIVAEKREHYRLVKAALSEFPAQIVDQAVALLEAEALYRSEKVSGPARWLQNLHATLSRTRNERVRDNLTWLAVASAPAGFCHIRSAMVGTLLEDLSAGLPVEGIKRRFDAKMDPLISNRPQAAPTAGNIQEAERIVAKLGLEPALHRRYARLDEIKALWRPKEMVQTAGTGVFGHLKIKAASGSSGKVTLPTSTLTWEKFSRTVLPEARSIEFWTGTGVSSYTGLVTAVHPEAPPILQWDFEDERNPVSWYLHARGSVPSTWGLPSSRWIPVTAITRKPCRWSDTRSVDHHADGVILVLEGARETVPGIGLALFPEFLKPELRTVRATIEEFSRRGQLEGREEASANGVMIFAGETSNALIRVTTRVSVADYRIDRWD
jgi:hypothetical protein